MKVFTRALGDVFFAILRFFNLLERDRVHVLSITNIAMWLCLFVMVFVMVTMPQDTGAVATSVVSQLIATAGYGVKKYETAIRDRMTGKPHGSPRGNINSIEGLS